MSDLDEIRSMTDAGDGWRLDVDCALWAMQTKRHGERSLEVYNPPQDRCWTASVSIGSGRSFFVSDRFPTIGAAKAFALAHADFTPEQFRAAGFTEWQAK